MTTDSSWLARQGQNPQVVAAFAHSGWAFIPVTILSFFVWHHPAYWALAVTGLAIWKEFVYDLKDERDPPQTFSDSLQDFAGYELGAWLAVLVVHAKL